MVAIDDWWDAGEILALALGGGAERRVFVRRLGEGPTITLLHGFPSCSFDWARIAGPLSAGHRLLMPDLLGFGASEKPPEHRYSIHEQADLVEALWRGEGVSETAIVAHDYSVSVTQELLARNAEGRLAVELTTVTLLNGGLYPDLHRPEPAQLALLDPELGRSLNDQLTGELITAALAPTFAPGFDAGPDSEAIWRSIERGGAILDRLILYIRDREEHAERWVGALEQTGVPLSFIWGMLDPISGAHMAQRIRERLPAAPFAALAGVGHWPPLEAPDQVLAALAW